MTMLFSCLLAVASIVAASDETRLLRGPSAELAAEEPAGHESKFSLLFAYHAVVDTCPASAVEQPPKLKAAEGDLKENPDLAAVCRSAPVNCDCSPEDLYGAQFSSFGAAVAVDGSLLVAGAPFEGGEAGTWEGGACPEVTYSSDYERGAAIVFDITGRDQDFQFLLRPPSPQREERFGYAVAVAGGMVAVSAPARYNDEIKGAVYVFRRGTGTDFTFLLEQTLAADDENLSDRWGFGRAVAAAENVIVVGDPFYDSQVLSVGQSPDYLNGEALNTGRVLVFRRDAGSGVEPWTQETEIVCPGCEDEDIADSIRRSTNFGSAVAVSGEGALIAVGAPGRKYGPLTYVAPDVPRTPSTIGAAFVYRYDSSDGTWGQQVGPEQGLVAPEIEISGPPPPTDYGASVALTGETLVVGAPLTIGSSSYLGAAKVYKGPEWDLTATLQPDLDVQGDVGFGASVAIASTPLCETVVVGTAPAYNAGNFADVDRPRDLNAAYVYQDLGTWTQIAKLATDSDFNGVEKAVAIADSGVAAVGFRYDGIEETNEGPALKSDVDSSGAVYVYQLE